MVDMVKNCPWGIHISTGLKITVDSDSEWETLSPISDATTDYSDAEEESEWYDSVVYLYAEYKTRVPQAGG